MSTTANAKPETKKEKVPGYVVRSFETSFRRIGRRFTREPTFVAKADLTAAQIKTLLAEKKLIVQEVDDQPAN